MDDEEEEDVKLVVIIIVIIDEGGVLSWFGLDMNLGLFIYIYCYCYILKNVDVYFVCLFDCDSVFFYKVKVIWFILKYMYCFINLFLRIFVCVYEWVREMFRFNFLEYRYI